MIVAIPFYWKNPNGCHRGQVDCHVTGGCTGGKTTRGHPRHRNGVRDRKVERYDHQSVTSHACIGRRSSVSDLDSCGQKWIPFRTRLSERRSECATSGNWIAVRRSFGRRRSSVGRRSVGRSVGRTVSIPFNCFRRKCTTATPRILPNYRTSRPAKRSTTKSRQTNQHAVRIPIHIQLSRDKWMGKTLATSLANVTKEANIKHFGQANLAAPILPLS